jgi:predicted MFS family arabinose efflux permease
MESDNTLKVTLSIKEWQVLILLAAINFTHTMDFVMVIPMGPILIQKLGINAAQVGHIVSSYTISASVFGLLGAGFIDKIERKTALLYSFLGLIVGTFFCAYSQSYHQLLMARALAGASGGLMSSMVYAYVGDYINDSKRGRATGIVMNSYSIASILGIPLGLLLAEKLDWNSPFLYLSALGLLFMILAYFWLPSLQNGKKQHNAFQVYAQIFKNTNIQWALLFMVLLTFAGFSVIPFISTFVVSNAGLPQDKLMLMYLVSGIVNFFAGPFIGKLADKYGKYHVFSITAILSVIPTMILGFMYQSPLMLTLLVTTTLFLFFSARYVPAMALISSGVEQAKRGGFLTISNSVQQFCMGASSYLVGLFIYTNRNGELQGFLYGATIASISIMMSIWVGKKIKMIS